MAEERVVPAKVRGPVAPGDEDEVAEGQPDVAGDEHHPGATVPGRSKPRRAECDQKDQAQEVLRQLPEPEQRDDGGAGALCYVVPAPCPPRRVTS